MSVLSFLFIIFIPAAVSFITMTVVLCMQWMLEKEVNDKQPSSIFHLFNVLFIMMMFGTSSIVFHGFLLEGVNEKGWGTVSLYAYVYPLPIILFGYVAASRFFRSYVQPYRVLKKSNVVYINRKSKSQRR
ncbi:hypothetical protein [Salibacterium aidingense]|uniref:hypothetical protein n=1 Tax=Salibacterium aidingense TaxID=384933 RepID=UPI00041AFC99|nr:hypothetical protein [Salibacterium aidingense]